MIRVALMEKVKNSVIIKRHDVIDDVVFIIDKEMLRWLEHLERMHAERNKLRDSV